MRLKDTVVTMGDNTPTTKSNWVIAAGDPDTGTGVFMGIPIAAYIAGGNVNDAQHSYITRVTYTIESA